MTARTASLTSFIAACLLTAGTWCLCWPEAPSLATPQDRPPEPPPRPRLERARIPGLANELNTASSNQARLIAATEFENLRIEDFPGVFDSVQLIDGRELTRAGKTLLILWASMDGKAAAQWSWMRLRGEGLWSHAINQIAPAWAWHDPAGLADWTLAVLKERKANNQSLSLTEVLQIDAPIFESVDVESVGKALLKEDPRLALTVFLTRGGSSSSDHLIPQSFTGVEDIREAVLAFDNLEGLKITRILTPGERDYLAMAMLQRWKELDPADFARSPYAGVLDSAASQGSVISDKEWKALPPEQRASGAMKQIAAYDDRTRLLFAAVIARSWAMSDPAGCRAWIESLPEDLQAPAAFSSASAGARSDLVGTLGWAEGLQANARARAMIAAFESWKSVHPGDQPESSDWPRERRQAWEDLAALNQLQSP